MYRSQRPSGKPKPPIAERRPKISQDVPLRRGRGVCEGRRDLRIACHDGGGLSVAGTSGDVSSTEGAWRVCPCLPLLGREATVWTRGAEVVDSGGSLCLRTVDPTWRGPSPACGSWTGWRESEADGVGPEGKSRGLVRGCRYRAGCAISGGCPRAAGALGARGACLRCSFAPARVTNHRLGPKRPPPGDFSFWRIAELRGVAHARRAAAEISWIQKPILLTGPSARTRCVGRRRARRHPR